MFDPKESFLIKNLLGDGAEEELAKSAIYKLSTNTVVEPTEMVQALQIVPRTILSWLKAHVAVMKEKENKVIKLDDVSEKAKDHVLFITKSAEDVYQGEIVCKGEVVARIINRPLPSLGLVLMTMFELYDIQQEVKTVPSDDMISKIQDIIDRRFALQNTIEAAVDQKIAEINRTKAIVADLVQNSNLKDSEKPSKIDEFRSHQDVKTARTTLKQFLDKKKAKLPQIIMAKGKTHTYPDCGSNIFKNEAFTPCICFGDDRNKKIFIAKTETKVVVKFSSGWEPENIEMLLEAIRAKRHPHEEG